jgi:hypothetical protein
MKLYLSILADRDLKLLFSYFCMKNILFLSTDVTETSKIKVCTTRHASYHSWPCCWAILIPLTAVLCLSVNCNEHVVVRKILHFHTQSINFFWERITEMSSGSDCQVSCC